MHVELGYQPDDSVVTGMRTHWHAQIGIHEEKTAGEVIDTINHHILRQGHLKRAGAIMLVLSPELATILVRDGVSKAELGQRVFDGTMRSKKWMKENELQTWRRPRRSKRSSRATRTRCTPPPVRRVKWSP